MSAAIPAGRPAPSVQQVYDRDTNPAPAVLRAESPATGQSTDDILKSVASA